MAAGSADGANELKAWWGPAIALHPWWQGTKFHTGFRFEARSAADALRQADEAYSFVIRDVTVELAESETEMREALARFLGGSSRVLKICAVN
jgi:hypothetical protein